MKEYFEELDAMPYRTLKILDCIVLLVIALCPLYYAGSGRYGVYQLLGAAFLFCIMLTIVAVRPFYFYLRKYSFFYLLIIVQMIVMNNFQGTNWIQSTKVLVIAFMIMVLPLNEWLANVILPVMSLSGFITGIYMLLKGTYYAGFRLTLTIGGIQQDPNWVALLFIIPFAYSLYYVSNNRKPLFLKILCIITMLLSVYETVLTGSRGALIGIIFVVIVWLVQEIGVSLERGIFLLIVIIVILTFVDNIATKYLPSDIIMRFTSTSTDDSRITIWTNIIHEYSNGNILQILLGRGDGACVRVIGMGAHNDALETLFEFGLVGLILHIIYWIEMLKYVNDSNNNVGVAILLALLAESMFSPIQTIMYFMMPVSAVICSCKNANTEDFISKVKILKI